LTVQGIVTEVRIDITFPNPGSGCSRVDAPISAWVTTPQQQEHVGGYIETGERREGGMMWVSFAEMWDTADIEEVYASTASSWQHHATTPLRASPRVLKIHSKNSCFGNK